MSKDLEKLAREKLRAEKRAAAQALKEKEKALKVQKKLEMLRRAEIIKASKREKEELAKVVKDILKVYNERGEFKDGNNFIRELNDGNIQGLIGNKYFQTYQEDGKSYIKVFEKTKAMASFHDPRDGAPDEVNALDVIEVRVGFGNKPVPATLSHNVYRERRYGWDFPSDIEGKKFDKENEIINSIDEYLNLGPVEENTTTR